MGSKHKKGRKRSNAPKISTKNNFSKKWIYIIGIIAIGILLFQYFNSNDYPAKITPKLDRGTIGAPILIEEFSDLECPACARTHIIMKQIMNDYNGSVTWRFYHYPLRSIHPHAQLASVGAECAADQGIFWEYIDMVYENREHMSKNDLINYATTLGANESFKECISSNTKNNIITADINEGNKRRITGTPTIYVNGKKVNSLNYESISQLIEIELQ